MVVGRAPSRLLSAGLSLATVACVLALLPSAGHARKQTPIGRPADCGGVEEVYPAHHPRGQIPPLAIGDSTMLLALDQLAADGFDANAHGCRQYPEALALLSRRKAEGRLPHMVVVALGGDGSVTHDDIGETIGLLCCTRLLVIVTNRELGGGSGQDAVTEREEAAKHPGRIKLLDWVAYARGHGGDWFQPDGLHLTDLGARVFSAFLDRAMNWAYPPKKKHKHHRRKAHPAT